MLFIYVTTFQLLEFEIADARNLQFKWMDKCVIV